MATSGRHTPLERPSTVSAVSTTQTQRAEIAELLRRVWESIGWTGSPLEKVERQPSTGRQRGLPVHGVAATPSVMPHSRATGEPSEPPPDRGVRQRPRLTDGGQVDGSQLGAGARAAAQTCRKPPHSCRRFDEDPAGVVGVPLHPHHPTDRGARRLDHHVQSSRRHSQVCSHPVDLLMVAGAADHGALPQQLRESRAVEHTHRFVDEQRLARSASPSSPAREERVRLVQECEP